MTSLLELAELAERATGPDRELDIAIWRLVDPKAIEVEAQGKRPLPWLHRYTASIDAAMTLAATGWKLRQLHFSAPCADDRKWHVNLYGGKEGEDTFVGRGATMALVLVSASLRSLASQGDQA